MTAGVSSTFQPHDTTTQSHADDATTPLLTDVTLPVTTTTIPTPVSDIHTSAPTELGSAEHTTAEGSMCMENVFNDFSNIDCIKT